MTESAPAPDALDVADLTVALHRDGAPNTVLSGVSLRVAPGEIVALVGESGSGKSTLGLTVAGLLAAEAEALVSGAIHVAGKAVLGLGADQRRSVARHLVGMVFQDPMTALNPTMRIRRQLAEAILDGTNPAAWMARVGLVDAERMLGAYPHQLSGGQRQRVMIAIAMARKPSLVICDEPTTALDVTVQADILRLMARLARDERTGFLFITHDLAIAAVIADRMIVLNRGRIVEEGPAEAIIAQPRHAYSRMLLGARFGLDADRTRPLPVPDRDGDRAPAGGTWPPRQSVQDAPLLELFRISKSYPGKRRDRWGRRLPRLVLQDINLRLGAGEALSIVGESGSGKSTLIRIIADLVQQTSGDRWYGDGAPPQLVYQDATASFTPWLSVGAQITERLRPLRLSAAETRLRVGATLDACGLPADLADARPAELSGGQCQRAAIARAVIVPPRLLLCDEAVSAMDVTLAAGILNLIGKLRRQHCMGLIFVTHDLAAARFVADRMVVLRDGRIEEIGDAETVVTAPVAAYTRRLLAAMPERMSRGAFA